jgi:3-oxoacyl-(acyl-carrier-protein) synthase III
MKARIHSFKGYVPSKHVSSADIEQAIAKSSPQLPIIPGTIALLTGITTLPRAEDTEQASDMAVMAAKEFTGDTSIDLLIFASASQDVTEPATANIIQQKLGLTCAVLDVKNACNSFLNGLQVARAFVEAGMYKNVLVVTGETPSRAVSYEFATKEEYKAAFASLTLGDGGGAALVTASETSNVSYMQFYSYGQHWQLAAYIGGGSMHLKDPQFMRFTGNGTDLKNSFLRLGPSIVETALQDSGNTKDSIDAYFIHQVAGGFTNETIEMLGVPSHKVYRTVEKHGNVASASIPIALWKAQQEGFIQKGSSIFILGLASGISVSTTVMTL